MNAVLIKCTARHVAMNAVLIKCSRFDLIDVRHGEIASHLFSPQSIATSVQRT